MAHAPDSATAPAEKSSNFLRHAVESDLSRQADRQRRIGDGAALAHGIPDRHDPMRVRTRFPPEPNGYLHIGHAKSVWLNASIARENGGAFHLRFDDTNPEKEEQEYVDSIVEIVDWLGGNWHVQPDEKAAGLEADHLYFASDYFESLYQFAEYLIELGYAYVDSQSAEDIRAMRGTLTEAGKDSPFRNRSVEENLQLFRAMRAGEFADGAHVLRARLDMASPNINLRDPVIYRIRHAHHHRTGDAWCIYPLYDYTHCISDALENITHSICTLEFEDHRPLYDWVLERIVPVLRPAQFTSALELVKSMRDAGGETSAALVKQIRAAADKLGTSEAEQSLRKQFADGGEDALVLDAILAKPSWFAPLLTHALDSFRPNPFGLPHQFEFARLNLTYMITSKRRLRQLVLEQHVQGWDDPRMPTLVGLRRRGFTPAAINLMCERTGVSRSDSWIDYSLLEAALRDDLDPIAPRVTAVLDPLPLILDNVAETTTEWCEAPVHPHDPERGKRRFPFTRALYIERDDFMETPVKGYFRLYPGNRVRLRHAFVVECTGCEKDGEGRVTAVHANILPDSRSGTPGADAIKVKGNIHWVSQVHAFSAEVRLYDRLFAAPQPDAVEGGFLAALNPHSFRRIEAKLEPGASEIVAGTRVQFERHGYFIADALDSKAGAPVFNRITTLKDSWGKPA